MGWLSVIGAAIRLVLRVLGFISDQKKEEKERKKEVEDAIKELEEKDDITNGDIVDIANRMQ